MDPRKKLNLTHLAAGDDKAARPPRSAATETFDLDALLHPAHAFDHPQDVLRDPDLTLNEKRAILASWASDACAVDNAPSLRHARGGRAVTFDDIVDALRALDQEAAQARVKLTGSIKRKLRSWRRDRNGGGGFGLQ